MTQEKRVSDVELAAWEPNPAYVVENFVDGHPALPAAKLVLDLRAARQRIAELEAEVAALRKDKERLDVLEALANDPSYPLKALLNGLYSPICQRGWRWAIDDTIKWRKTRS